MGMLFTDRELEVMNVVWDHGSATVNEAREILGRDRPYTSVLTIFQTLEEKRHIRHVREGKAYRWFPEVSREEARRDAVAYVLESYFQNSAVELLHGLLRVAKPGPNGIRRMREQLATPVRV